MKFNARMNKKIQIEERKSRGKHLSLMISIYRGYGVKRNHLFFRDGQKKELIVWDKRLIKIKVDKVKRMRKKSIENTVRQR